MKKQIATVLLFCYVLVFLKPVLPVVADALAHLFWQRQHEATVHFENGKYHLHVEVKKATEETPAAKNPSASADETLAFHLQPAAETNLPEEPSGQPDFLIVPAEKPFAVFREVPAPPPWKS